MTDALQAKREAVCNREDFQEKAYEVRSAEDILSLLHKNGVDLDEDDIDYCMELAENQMKENGYMTEEGELSEEMLEIVAGGGIVDGIVGIVFGGGCIGMGAAYIGAAKAGIAGYTACMALGGFCCAVGAAFVVAGAIGIGYAIYKKRKSKK